MPKIMKIIFYPTFPHSIYLLGSHAPRFATVAALHAHHQARHGRAGAWANVCQHADCTWRGWDQSQLFHHRAHVHRQLSWVPSQSAVRNAMRNRQARVRVTFTGHVSMGM